MGEKLGVAHVFAWSCALTALIWQRMFLLYNEMRDSKRLGPMIASAVYWRFRSKA